MSAYRGDFETEFLWRTIKLLEENQNSGYEVTALINYTLALLILPTERENTDEFASLCVTYLRDNEVKLPGDLKPDTTTGRTENQQHMHRIRNGFAHANIKAEHDFDADKIVAVTVWNESNKKINYEVTFPVDKLNSFCIYVAKIYLDKIEKQKND